jgi:hypothetical protein
MRSRLVRSRLLPIALSLILLSSQSALSWNGRGQMTVAAIAYLQLTETTKTKVDTLLAQHPDFALLSQGIPSDDPNFGLRVFMKAATWPDLIKSDPRFVDGDELEPGDPVPLPNFPHMLRGRNWHFINVPFSTDGTATQPPRPINALGKIVEFRASLGDRSVMANLQAYNLAWLIHLVGDIHQPLHAVARFTSQHPNGDRGGNDFKIQGSPDNLHTLWDDLLGSSESTQSILKLANSVTAEFQSRNPKEISIPATVAPILVIRSWIDESATLANYFVYTVGPEGTPNPKPVVTGPYRDLAKTMARHRIAIAGYRLSSIISDRVQ